MGQYTQLSVTDRRRLFVFLEMGLSVREIAFKLSRHRSTIYRELNRNTEFGLYLPIVAQQKAIERSKNGRPNKLKDNGVLRDYVTRSLLDKGWSPEQILWKRLLKNLKDCLKKCLKPLLLIRALNLLITNTLKNI